MKNVYHRMRKKLGLKDSFLEKYRSPDYKTTVKELPNAYQDLGCNMSLKDIFLHSHINSFPVAVGMYQTNIARDSIKI